ncbi:MAG: hypothetical protein COA79_12280 [Planctomycetota bacterium]|nr:MAG: hypothetical protein COA79_12280 [Planctomycetota bacterium]
MHVQLICQAVSDLLEEKKMVPLEKLQGRYFDSLSEYRLFLETELSIPNEVMDLLLEESKTRIYSCCGREYYFSPNVDYHDSDEKTCVECGVEIKNHYFWDEYIPSLFVKDAGLKFIVKTDNFYFGRRKQCELCLDDIDLSRKHCVIRMFGRRYKLIDLGSRNGTYLNGKKISEAYIKAGDTIRLGKHIRIVIGMSKKTESVKIKYDNDSSHIIGESSITDMLIGVEMGKYLIKENLGKGGMGVVYLADNVENGQEVAVKVLRASRKDEPGVEHRFNKEKNVLKQLHSDHIIQYLDAGQFNGLNYIVMEYFGKFNLGEYISIHGVLTLPVSVNIILKVLKAMEQAHGSGIIHRDIKPENVLVDEELNVRITDFGLMKNLEASQTGLTTVTGVTLGTPSYMAPEQIKTAKNVTVQTDVYGIGATLFHMLTGRPPYEGVGAIEILMKVGEEPLPKLNSLVPDLPIWICDIVDKALEFGMEDRFSSAMEFRKEIESHLNELS